MSAPDSYLEIERKYAVDAGFVLPDLSGAPGVAAVTGPRTYHLTAVYHDTLIVGYPVAPFGTGAASAAVWV